METLKRRNVETSKESESGFRREAAVDFDVVLRSTPEQGAPTFRRFNVLLCLLWLLALIAGCATAPAEDIGHPTAAIDRPAEPTVQNFLPGGERGLEVRQWLMADETEVIAEAMMQYGSTDGLNHALQDRLRRNGLRLMRVPLERLGELEMALGGASMHNVGWHGQVFDWQEVIARPVTQPLAIAVDGRARMFEPGTMRLMGRAWLVQMENGTKLTTQIVPQHYRPGPMTYYRLLGRDTGTATSMVHLAIDLVMEEGHAYVLTCESPAVEWEETSKRPNIQTTKESESGIRSEAEVSSDVVQRSTPEQGAPTFGRFDVSHGPDVLAPTTLGQFMLTSDYGTARAGARGFIVFIPRIHSRPETDLSGIARRRGE